LVRTGRHGRERLSGLRLVAGLAALALALLVGSGTADAAQTMSLSAAFATGTHRGEPTTASVAIGIGGTEYGGSPLPLHELTLDSPLGAVLSNARFATCPASTLEPTGKGPLGCPPGSQAGPAGRFSAEVAFASKRVPEEGTVETFFSPEGGILMFMYGHEPTLFEVIATGKYTSGGGTGGPGVAFEFPRVETVPGGPLASITAIDFGLGSFRVEPGGSVGSVSAPADCATNITWEVSATFTDEEGTVGAAHELAGGPCPEESAAQRKAAEAVRAAVEAEAKKKQSEAAAAAILAQLNASADSLARLLVPRGHGASSREILKHGGYAFAVAIPPGASLTVDWYLVPPGAHLSTRRPVLVAAGSATARSARVTKITIRLTSAGRRLLKRNKRAKLTARATLRDTQGTTVVKQRRLQLSR
jgi:hypothetical protein